MGDGDPSGPTPPPLQPDASSPQSAPVSDVPQPRILMSPGPHTPNSAFFTQVLAQQPPYQGVNE
jgi:anthranilate/para-aminobenzoate synthase component II